MNRRHLYTVIATAALGLSLPALSAGNSGGNGGASGGNSGSHGGGHSDNGNANAGVPPDAGSKGKSSQTGKSAQSSKTVAQQLTDRKQLSAKLGPLLPAGTDLQTAAAGFKNLGQFVAAVHVSNNLGIPFSDLKTKMMDGASLGAAIKALHPEANATAEATKAQRQANQDLATRR